MKSTRKILTVILSAILILSAVPLAALGAIDNSAISVPDVNAGVIDFGTCGDNLTWTLDDLGLLTVTGTGEMNYITGAPWISHANDITGVYITTGVTSIAGGAFDGYSNITAVSIADSVSEIGIYALRGTAWLAAQPNGVVYAGRVAYCYSGAMPENTVITLRENTTGIAGDAFYNMPNLVGIVLPVGLKTIGNSAFGMCTGLTDIEIPDGVTKIGIAAFRGSTNLTSISLPLSIAEADYSSFEQTPWFNNQPSGVVYLGGVVLFYNGAIPENTELVLREGTKTIGEGAFAGQVNLKSIIIPDSVSTIKMSAFYRCSSLTAIQIPDAVTEINHFTFYECKALSSVDIGTNVRSIGNYAFYCCEALTSVVIPDAAQSIGQNAFFECSSLVSADLGDGVKSIGPNSFYGCSELTSVILPEELTYIGSEAFTNCYKLAQINLSDTITIIGENAFLQCSALTEIHVPAGITEIREGTFLGCWGLQEISIPKSVTAIANSAFSNCVQLKDVYIYSRNIEMLESAIGFVAMAFNGEISIEEYLALIDLDMNTENDEVFLTQANELLGTNFATMDEMSTYMEANVMISDGLIINPELVIHGYGGTDSETYADTFGIQFECMHGNTRVINAVEVIGCTAGYSGDTYCDDCDEIAVTGEILPGGDHTPINVPGIAATCTQTGLTDGTKCTVCNQFLTAQTVIAALGHSDANADGYCDRCNDDIRAEEPEQGQSFFEKIAAFFQKIIDFFRNLFN